MDGPAGWLFGVFRNWVGVFGCFYFFIMRHPILIESIENDRKNIEL